MHRRLQKPRLIFRASFALSTGPTPFIALSFVAPIDKGDLGLPPYLDPDSVTFDVCIEDIPKFCKPVAVDQVVSVLVGIDQIRKEFYRWSRSKILLVWKFEQLVSQRQKEPMRQVRLELAVKPPVNIYKPRKKL